MRLALLAALLATAQFAAAQVPAMPVFEKHARTYGLHIGRAAPTKTNNFAQSASPGAALVFQHLRYPVDWIAYGAELTHASMGGATLTNFGALLRINMLRERTWTPYVLSGVGWHSGKVEAGSSAALTVSGGLGLEFFVVQSLSVVLEGRFHQYRLSSAAGGQTAESFSILIGANLWRY